MKKTAITAFLVLPFITPSLAFAGDFDFEHEVHSRFYYGVMDTNKKASNNNMANRAVNRNDIRLKLSYDFSNDYKITIINDSAAIFRQHDSRYDHNGEWRFYTYGNIDSPYGRFSAGENFNVAHQFHKGATDFSPIGVGDTNLTWFLSNHNWKNGKDSVSFKTPKSTAIMEDGRAFKASYITPKLGNTLFGFTYTPDSPSRRGLTSRYNTYERDDAYVVAMHNEWELDFGDLYTSVGYGLFNRTDKVLSLGTTLTTGGWTFAAGYRKSYVDGNKNPITTVSTDPRRPAFFDNYRESQAWDFSVGYKIGPLKTSLAYLHTKADNTPNQDDIVMLTNTYALNKWFDVYAIGGYINSKGIDKQDANRNKGYAGIVGLGINF